ncbi:glycosyltransferase family 39 protein [Francisella adeliensis]|uniref:Glycosyltransferase family 39 protein n=1 Tax=Francisella adeliensis TaxID=2007306 RepID=A0A2Z4XWF9_9GAMM|nr:glycosyltransferase family 39 protein [Francisella adeliensis]AXA33194.1 hypothetical protein CDH04_01600 [Francisella adeliensis]MBK2085087.1 glycosyltransferase family 39 protein [Francisella adeliensis]MBK2096922.1 glycosyltransferase family 39 protein [Francisella adeliensis]QIW11422.1 glycosyltransferase family 39 protein [Francisella adeliensis]QIW13297.1 glycosyltransferase family 39 protein [Francisella adeliensis]
MFKKNNPLVLFLFGFLVIWVGFTLLIHSPSSISPDTAENMMWGMKAHLVYDKHPGLGPLFLIPFTYLFNSLLADLLAVSVCIFVTWFYLYRTIKLFYPIKEAIMLFLLSVASFFYMGEFFIQYNQNIILLPFWSASTYYFAKAITGNKRLDWVLLAIFTALGVYAKFQIGLIAIAMLICIVMKFDKKCLVNICIAILVGTIFLLPGFISLYSIDFETLDYVTARVSEPDSSFLHGFLYAAFDSVFQLLNLSIAIIVFIYLLFKKRVVRCKKEYLYDKKILIILGLAPYIIFVFLESLNGMLPTEWLVCTTVFLLPAIYALLNLKLVDMNINLHKLVAFILIVNLVYFVSFNLNTFFNNNIEHNNIGDSVALSAENFLTENNLPQPNFASGNWEYGFYLSVFMQSKPHYYRIWQNKEKPGVLLLAYPGCDNTIDVTVYGYKLLKKSCEEVKIIDKYNTQYKKFDFYLAEK